MSLASAATTPVILTLNRVKGKNLDGAHIESAVRNCHCERSEAIPAGGSSGPFVSFMIPQNDMCHFQSYPGLLRR